MTVENYRKTLTKHREAKKGHGWTKLESIEIDFEKCRPTLFQIYISLYQNVIYTAGKSFSVVMWP